MNLFMLPIADVRITRRRERQDLGDLDSLGASILKFGQLVPIIVDKDNELIDGQRRLTARQENGDSEIMCILKDDVDAVLAKELELETNLQRKDMTWQERARGLAELDRMKREKDPNWTQMQTAQVAGNKTQQRDVSVALKAVKMMELFPEIAEAKSLPKAMAQAEAKIKSVQRIIKVQDAPEDYRDIEERLWHGDSVVRIKEIPDNSFNAVITDPPFGIDAEDRTAGSTISDTSAYQDDKDKYEYLLTMLPDVYRVMTPNSFLIWFLGHSWYERVRQDMLKCGFVVDPCPIMWDRSDGRTFTTRPDRWFAKGYDIALHAIKGNPKLAITGKSNVLRVPPVPSSEKDILFERPVELYAELIRRTTIEGEVVADFFAGSGSCPAAAASLKRNWFACELDMERRAKAITKIKAHTPTVVK